MVGQKACKACKTIYTGTKCPRCGSEESSDSPKGKIVILDSQESELARNLKIKEKGVYAIRV